MFLSPSSSIIHEVKMLCTIAKHSDGVVQGPQRESVKLRVRCADTDGQL